MLPIARPKPVAIPLNQLASGSGSWVRSSPVLDPETVYLRLLARSQDRRGADVERYSRRTIEKALSEVAERQSRDDPP